MTKSVPSVPPAGRGAIRGCVGSERRRTGDVPATVLGNGAGRPRNDGDLDLVIANGHIDPQIDRYPEIIGTFAQRNMILEDVGTPGAPRFGTRRILRIRKGT
jgi:hypothetical protein